MDFVLQKWKFHHIENIYESKIYKVALHEAVEGCNNRETGQLCDF